MKKFIIVTGGAGFIGSNLIEELVKLKKYSIISIDNYSAGSKKNHINSHLVRYVRGDTLQIEKICKNLKNQILVIFHFGEFSRIHQSFEKYKECFESNISGTSKIINFCCKYKIKLIYSATSASLGNHGKDQFLSPYSFSKSKNIEMILNMKKWFGLNYEIIYFFNVYGKRHIRSGYMSTVIGVFENLYLQKKPMTVVSPGTQTRKFTHIKDTIEGCIFAWKRNKNLEYLISNNKIYKITDVAKMFSNKMKMTQPRLGERYKSAEIKKIAGRTITKINCKLDLRTYISNFKKYKGM